MSDSLQSIGVGAHPHIIGSNYKILASPSFAVFTFKDLQEYVNPLKKTVHGEGISVWSVFS